MNTNDYSRYVWTFSLTFIFLCVSLVSLNWLIDPTGIFGNNRLGIYYRLERESKQGMVHANRYDGILMGSSKVAAIYTQDLASYPIFNAAFSSALPEEIFFFLRDQKPKVKFVGIGLDFFMFNERTFPFQNKSSFSKTTPSRADSITKTTKYLFSGDMVRYSFGTVKKFLLKRQTFLRTDGARNLNRELENEKSTLTIQKDNLRTLLNINYNDFLFSTKRLNTLSQIKQWEINNCVPIVLWINPLSPAAIDLIHSMSVTEDWSRLKIEVKSIFPDLIDLSESIYSNEKNFLKSDQYHYYPRIGITFFQEHIKPVVDQKMNIFSGGDSKKCIRKI